MQAILAIAAAVGLVWAAAYALRGSLVAGVLAFIVVGAVFGHPFFHANLGGLPLTLDRPILLLLVAAFALQRQMGRTDPKPLTKTDIGLIAFLALLVASGTLVGWHGGPMEKWVPIWRFAGGYLVPFAIYWIVRQSPLECGDVSAVYATLVGLGVYLGVTGILEFTGQWWAVFPPHIADPQLGLHFGRARGPMVHSVSYGLYLGVCLAATGLYAWRFGRAGKAVLALLALPMVAGLAFSYTRSVWMGAGLAFAALVYLGVAGRFRWVILGGMAAAGLLAVAVRSENLLSFQREYTAADTARSVSMRGSFGYVSWRMFLDRPLIGFGFGQFPLAKLEYLEDRSTELDLESIRPYVHHNTFLSILTETGLVGLGLFLAVLAGWLRRAIALARSAQPQWSRAGGLLLVAALAIYVCQAAFHELSYTPIDHCLLFLVAGMATGLSLRPAEGDAVGAVAAATYDRRGTRLAPATPIAAR